MKSLINFIKEEIFSTPGSTLGMGNMSLPTDIQPGSGDIPQCIDIKTGKIYKRKKKFKRYKI